MNTQDRIIRLPEVINQVSLSTPTIYRYIASGTFPKPMKIGVKSIGWMQSSITEWIASRQVSHGGRYA